VQSDATMMWQPTSLPAVRPTMASLAQLRRVLKYNQTIASGCDITSLAQMKKAANSGGPERSVSTLRA
jgi:hypothetical protein